MTARSPSAFMLSALFHGAIAVVILLLAFVAGEQRVEVPKIIELIATDGENFGAKVAPALGIPGGIKVTLPAPLPPALPPAPAPVESTPPPPAPEPVADKSPITPAPEPKAPPVKKPVTPTAPQPVDKVPNFAQQVKRVAAQRAARLEAQYKKQLEAERQRQVKADQAAKAAAAQQAKVKHIDTEGIKSGLSGGSTENKTGGQKGTALSREETDLMDTYYAYLKARVKENHEKPSGLSDTLVVKVAFFIGTDGAISRARVVKSSRSTEFDKSVIDAIKRTESIGKRPDGRSEEVALDFTMRDEDTN